MAHQHEGEGRSPVGAERPPNYLVRAIVLTLLLVPLGLLIGISKFAEAFSTLSGPPYRSEIPRWFSASMAAIAGLAGFIGIFMPVAALGKSLQVNSLFDSGNFLGAEKASRRSANYSKQSIIYLIALSLILFTDLFRYLTNS